VPTTKHLLRGIYGVPASRTRCAAACPDVFIFPGWPASAKACFPKHPIPSRRVSSGEAQAEPQAAAHLGCWVPGVLGCQGGCQHPARAEGSGDAWLTQLVPKPGLAQSSRSGDKRSRRVPKEDGEGWSTGVSKGG